VTETHFTIIDSWEYLGDADSHFEQSLFFQPWSGVEYVKPKVEEQFEIRNFIMGES